MSVIEVVNVSREVTWLPWAVQYFFLVGISVACFFMSVRGFAGTDGQSWQFARIALVGALVCGLVAPVALLADLHQPGRFWRFYASPNFKSWMAWGAFFIPAYLAGLLVYAWSTLRPELAAAGRGEGFLASVQGALSLGDRPVPAVQKTAAAFTALMGLLVLLYTGMEVMVVRARPLWDTPLLPLQFVATAFVGAAGLVLVLDRFIGDREQTTAATASRWLRWALIATIALGLCWFAAGWTGLSQTHVEALASVARLPSWRITAGWLAVAVVLPVLLSAVVPWRQAWLVGLLALHAAWMFRWTVFIGGQTLPKTGAGEYAYQLPLGHDGLLGIAGTVGLWLAALIILAALIPGRTTAPALRPAFAPAT